MKKIIKKVIVTIGISCIVTAVAPTTITNPLVVNAEAAVKISAKSANMLMGQTKQLKLTGTKKKATWASSNKNIVKVSSTGKITAVRPGKATISAKVDGRKYTCIATVKEIKVDLPKNTIKEDTTMKMTITNTPIGFAAPVWSTSNGNATITKDGVVTGVKAGDCTIILQVGP